MNTLKSEELKAERNLETVGQFKKREIKNKIGQALLIANIENDLLKHTEKNTKEYCMAISLKNNKSINVLDIGTRSSCDDKKISSIMKKDEKYIHLHTHTNHSPHSPHDIFRFLKDGRIQEMIAIVGDRSYIIKKTYKTIKIDTTLSQFIKYCDTIYFKLYKKNKKNVIRIYQRNKYISNEFNFLIKERLYNE